MNKINNIPCLSRYCRKELINMRNVVIVLLISIFHVLATASHPQSPLPGIEQTGSQQKTVTGKVTDEGGHPLPGVTVVIKGTTQGTATDIDGNYTLLGVADESVIIFSYIGMTTQEITVGKQTLINTIMIADAIDLDEVVAIGYGTMKKSDIIGSVATVKSGELARSQSGNVMNALQGKATGLNIVSNSQGTKVQIRGLNSINSNSDPLWVVDGVPSSQYINPADIESVEVLKDASATAIYGSRGSNGVILISTKKGRKKETSLDIHVHGGISVITKDLNDFGYADNNKWFNIMDLAMANSGQNPFLPQDIMNEEASRYEEELTREQAMAHNDNYFDELYRNGSYEDVNLMVNAGNEKGGTLFSANYRHGEGNPRNNSSDRFQFRTNSAYDISKNLHVGVRFFGLLSKGKSPGETKSDRHAPWYPIFDTKNRYGTGYWNTFYNPVANSDKRFKRNDTNNNRIFGGLFAEWKIPVTEGLSVRSEASFDHTNQTTSYYSHELIGPAKGSGRRNNAKESSTEATKYLYNLYFKYNQTFADKHSLSITAGVESERKKGYYRYIEGYSIPGEYQQLGPNPGTLGAGRGYLQGEEYLRSYFGRANYKFMNKYLAGISFRRDGVSNFLPNYRWGTFTAYSLGWIITEEEFFAGSEFLSLLKLRGSYGQTGNKAVPNKTSTTFKNSTQWQYGEHEWTQTGGTRPVNIGNKELTWETTSSYDIGIDYSFFNNRFNGSIAYYMQDVDGLVLAAALPPSTGLGETQSIWGNMGRMVNHGIEFSIASVNINKNDFRWSTTFNITTNKNEIKELAPSLDKAGVPLYHSDGGFDNIKLISKTGGSVKQWYLPEYAGVDPEKGVGMIWEIDYEYFLKTGETIKTGRKIPATQKNLALNLIQQKKKAITPTFFGGLDNTVCYKNFDLNLLFTFSGGNWLYDYEMAKASQPGRGHNVMLADLYDRSWKKPGDIAKYPELRYNDTHPWDWDTEIENPDSPTGKGNWIEGNGNYHQNKGIDSRNLYRGDFVKLKHIEFGFSFAGALLKKTRLSSLRIYFAGDNIFTITGYPGWDPEFALSSDGIPSKSNNYGSQVVTATYSAGLQISF